jgi:hypothetical protein
MTNRERRRYEMLVRVRDFGDSHQDLFPKSTAAGKLFVEIGDAVDEVGQHAVSKMSAHGAALEGGEVRLDAREALRERLDAIARTTRLMADDHPDLANTFRLPDTHTDQALLTAARLVARDAEAHQAAFVAHALPETFLADFKAALEEFEQGLHDRDAGRDQYLAARASIEATLASGWAAVRKLDVLVANRLHDAPVTMAVWERDRRVEYRSRSRSPAASTPAPQTTTTQTT